MTGEVNDYLVLDDWGYAQQISH